MLTDTVGEFAWKLIKLGLMPQYKGFIYISYLLENFNHELLHEYTTSAMCAAVGKHFGASWKSVDRDIKTLIEATWYSHLANKRLKQLFVDCDKPPSVGKFIKMMLFWHWAIQNEEEISHMLGNLLDRERRMRQKLETCRKAKQLSNEDKSI